ncbi:MAG: phage shock protein E [Crocinitomicaceae bacterium]|jgi:phage shock protein E
MGIGNFLSSIFGGNKMDFNELIQKGALVIDVRSPQEFKSGHLKGSKNIPLQKLQNSFPTLKNKTVILVCQSGARSGVAKSKLTQQGINAHNGGAWQNLKNNN